MTVGHMQYGSMCTSHSRSEDDYTDLRGSLIRYGFFYDHTKSYTMYYDFV